MDALRDRLTELAEDAPTSGAPPAELWTRGRRAQRVRAAALAATVLVAGATGTGVGVRLLDDDRRSDLAPVTTAGVTLPIDYPAGAELPDLGETPGPLAAVWLAPREPYTLDDDDAGAAPEAVGLVAETGTFGTLPIDLDPWVYEAPDAHFALSPGGHRIAYHTPQSELVVRDLVSGDTFSPTFDFEIRAGASWIDDTRLFGYVAAGSDADAWVWEPGTAPRRVNPSTYRDGSAVSAPPVDVFGGDPPWSCKSPIINNGEARSGSSVLCDVVGVIGSSFVLGHENAGVRDDPSYSNRAVIALDVRDGADFPFDDPALRRVVVNPGAPHPVTFATDLMADVLGADGGAS